MTLFIILAIVAAAYLLRNVTFDFQTNIKH